MTSNANVRMGRIPAAGLHQLPRRHDTDRDLIDRAVSEACACKHSPSADAVFEPRSERLDMVAANRGLMVRI